MSLLDVITPEQKTAVIEEVSGFLLEDWAENNEDAAELSDAELDEQAGNLFDNWYEGNLDEDEFYADQKIAEMSDNKEIKDAFNRLYALSDDNPDYVGYGL